MNENQGQDSNMNNIIQNGESYIQGQGNSLIGDIGSMEM